MRKSLDIYSFREQTIERKHVSKSGSGAISFRGDHLEWWATLLVLFAIIFVAEAPHNDRGVVPISFHQNTHILNVRRVVVEQTIFINDNNAQPVIDIKKSWVWWIMRGPSSITAYTSGCLSLKTEKVNKLFRKRCNS